MSGSTPNFIRVGTKSAEVPFPPLGSIGPNGGFMSVLLTHVFDLMSLGTVMSDTGMGIAVIMRIIAGIPWGQGQASR